MESILKDIRYGIRTLLQRPSFSVVAIITLTLGIGANTAIFSLMNTVLLRSLPITDPAKVVSVSARGKDDSMSAFSYPNYIDFRDHNEVLSGLIVYRFVPLSLSRSGNNERVWGYEVSGNYFDVLGVKAIRGRTFLPEEDRTRLTHPVAVLSYTGWQRRFAGDEGIVGKDVLLNDHPFRVIGIAPKGFKGTEVIYEPEIWLPAQMISWVEPGNASLDNRSNNNFFAVGRLKPGTTIQQAQASLNLLAQELARQYPDSNEGQTIKLIPPGFILPELRGAVVSFSWVLMAAVGLVLLVTCANLAGLLLARATDRRKEVAIRLALGANRSRLVRQLLTESILLSLVGGSLGVLLALWMINALLGFKPPIDFPLSMDIGIDWRVLVFSLGTSVVTGAIFGLAPALEATRPGLVTALKGTSSQAGGRRSRFRSGLVVTQLAFSLIVLISAGLVIRTLRQLQTMNPGFDTNNALTMSFDLGLQGYDKPRGEQFQRQLIERVRALPGVQSAALTDFIPLSLNYNSNQVFVEGQPAERGQNAPQAMVASITPQYFEAMGSPLLAGRGFEEQDKVSSEKVVIINETFVRRLMPFAKSNFEAVGKRVSFKGPEGPFARVVGVARDGKYFNISEDPRSFIWSPMAQSYSTNGILLVRTTVNPESMIAAVRGEVRSLDPNLPLFDVKTFREHMRLALFPAKIAATVLGVFGLVALLLAAIGIYGITSYSVSQQTRELGIRIALGAQVSDVLKLIFSHGLKLTMLGVGIGLIGAFLLTRAITSVLYGVSATDPLTFGLVSFVLIAIALIACYVPARRATRVDPLVALKYE